MLFEHVALQTSHMQWCGIGRVDNHQEEPVGRQLHYRNILRAQRYQSAAGSTARRTRHHLRARRSTLGGPSTPPRPRRLKV